MSAMACSAVEKTLATLYYIVEVKKVREPGRILAVGRRMGIDQFVLVLYLQHLRCVQRGREVVCYAEDEARKAYWKCKEEI